MDEQDFFVLRSNPNALRQFGLPYSPAYAARLARNGTFVPLTYLGPHKSGWYAN
jgi:hypothetical protein